GSCHLASCRSPGGCASTNSTHSCNAIAGQRACHSDIVPSGAPAASGPSHGATGTVGKSTWVIYRRRERRFVVFFPRRSTRFARAWILFRVDLEIRPRRHICVARPFAFAARDLVSIGYFRDP